MDEVMIKDTLKFFPFYYLKPKSGSLWPWTDFRWNSSASFLHRKAKENPIQSNKFPLLQMLLFNHIQPFSHSFTHKTHKPPLSFSRNFNFFPWIFPSASSSSPTLNKTQLPFFSQLVAFVACSFNSAMDFHDLNPNQCRLIGNYILGPRIGSGSFAVVWKSRHRHLGTVVAVKEIDKKHLNPKVSDSLLKEISILSTINHPNIIRLFEAIQVKFWWLPFLFLFVCTCDFKSWMFWSEVTSDCNAVFWLIYRLMIGFFLFWNTVMVVTLGVILIAMEKYLKQLLEA